MRSFRLLRVTRVPFQCTAATRGQSRSLSIHKDERSQQKLRAKGQTQCGLASLPKRMMWSMPSPIHWRTQGGAPATKVCVLQIAARYEEEHRLAS